MTAVRSRDVMVQPKSRSVFGHAWARQKGTHGRNPNSALHIVTGDPTIQCGRLPK